jgi:hypothetical protein
MDKAHYMRLLQGEGKQYKNTNLYILEGSGSTIEERTSSDICPPTNLNPYYLPDPKVQRPGKIQQQQQPLQQQQQRQPRQRRSNNCNNPYQIDPEVLRHIFNGRR